MVDAAQMDTQMRAVAITRTASSTRIKIEVSRSARAFCNLRLSFGKRPMITITPMGRIQHGLSYRLAETAVSYMCKSIVMILSS